LIGELRPMPGVESYLARASVLGLLIAVVSSNHVDWIRTGLAQMDLSERWHHVESADDDVARSKPRPDLYLAALERLSLEPGEAIAIEDSPNGIRAAKDAGLFCLAVPSDVTRGLDLSAADLVVDSLTALPLDELLRRAEGVGADS
jgi:HAD superfamily hydrolase (TIGR01509 family)